MRRGLALAAPWARAGESSPPTVAAAPVASAASAPVKNVRRSGVATAAKRSGSQHVQAWKNRRARAWVPMIDLLRLAKCARIVPGAYHANGGPEQGALSCR